MLVHEIMTTAVECCVPTDTAQHAAEIMRKVDIGVIPVLAGETDPKVVGMVTDRDLCMAVVAEGRDSRQVRVQECMTGKVVALNAEDDVEHAAEVMAEAQVRRLPVVGQNGSILGIVALADVARAVELASNVGDAVRDISEPTSELTAQREDDKAG